MSKLPSTYTICAYMRLSKEDSDVFGRKIESGSISSQRRLIMDYINKQREFAGCNVIERCDDAFDAGNLTNLLKCNGIEAAAVPAKCHFHVVKFLSDYDPYCVRSVV